MATDWTQCVTINNSRMIEGREWHKQETTSIYLHSPYVALALMYYTETQTESQGASREQCSQSRLVSAIVSRLY